MSKDIPEIMLDKIESVWRSPNNVKLNAILKTESDEKAALYGVTVSTLASSSGKHETTVRRRLNELVKVGRVFKYQMFHHPAKYWPL